jgi:hypothetical protein
MGYCNDESDKYLEVLEELHQTRNILKKINDTVLRTVTAGELEKSDYAVVFDEILGILLSDAESRGNQSA